jgi:hypothetical protein
VIIFGSVRFLSKKVTKPNFFKKIRNQTETGSKRPVSVFFKSIFLVWLSFGLGFFQFSSVFFGLGSVQFVF